MFLKNNIRTSLFEKKYKRPHATLRAPIAAEIMLAANMYQLKFYKTIFSSVASNH
jgi:hypothetical protein